MLSNADRRRHALLITLLSGHQCPTRKHSSDDQSECDRFWTSEWCSGATSVSHGRLQWRWQWWCGAVALLLVWRGSGAAAASPREDDDARASDADGHGGETGLGHAIVVTDGARRVRAAQCAAWRVDPSAVHGDDACDAVTPEKGLDDGVHAPRGPCCVPQHGRMLVRGVGWILVARRPNRPRPAAVRHLAGMLRRWRRARHRRRRGGGALALCAVATLGGLARERSVDVGIHKAVASRNDKCTRYTVRD
jgi:hypothetical protein